MKKILLSALLLAAGATAANAQSFEFYIGNELENDKVTNYTLIKEGDVYVAGNELNTNLGNFESIAYLLLKNKTAEPLDVTMDIEIEKKEFSPEALDANMDMASWCFFGNCSMFGENLLHPELPDATKSQLIAANGETPGGKGEHIEYAFMYENEEDVKKFKYDILHNCTVTANGETLHFSIAYKYDGSDTGIGGIEADNAQAEYYNLQGMRVSNPEKGQLYIVRKGIKTTKAVY